MDTKRANGYIAAIGMFDGVHRGHSYLLQQLLDEASRRNLRPLVLTFDAHPLKVLAPGHAPSLLSQPAQKRSLIAARGIDNIVSLHFTPDDFRSTAATFVSRLRDDFGVEALLMGFNNHIGSDRMSAPMLAALCDIPVIEAKPFPGEAISSTAVRSALAEGDVAEAARLLGRPHSISGTVVDGKKLGRTLGFPTANLQLSSPDIMIPAAGVYAVDAVLPDGSIHRAVTNIGSRPTVDNSGGISIETHIMDYSGDLYGKTMELRFLARLRDERRFESLDELKACIAADCLQARGADTVV